MMEFDLMDGITIGQGTEAETHHHVVLRQPTAADVIDAMQAAEKVVPTPEGYQLVSSPALMGIELMRRQVKKLGSLQGPLSVNNLRLLTGEDMAILQSNIEKLDEATAKEISERGRVSPARAGD